MRLRYNSLYLAALVACATSFSALAEPLPGNDIGVLKNEEVQVVQHALYEKEGRLSLGLQAGYVGADPYYKSGSLGLRGTYFLSESLGVYLTADGFYGSPTVEAERLSEFGGVTVDSYAPTVSAALGAEWSPIYAKLNVLGQGVVHYDIYLSGGVGVFLAQRSVFEGVDLEDTGGEGTWNTPAALHVGLGHRFFFRPGERTQSVVLDVKDHIFPAQNPDGNTWAKHNVHLSLGWSLFL